MKQIPIVENVLKLNDGFAALNRKLFNDAGVLTIELVGSPGSGKTAVLEATLSRLHENCRIGVMTGDLTTTRDAERLAPWTEDVVQINTGRACHLDANQVRQAVDQFDLDKLDLLFFENVGNLICPAGWDLGQDEKVTVLSIAEGDDKIVKHPYIVQASSVLLVNKIDLLPHVKFDIEQYRKDAAAMNPDAAYFEASATNDQVDSWIEWLTRRVETARERRAVTTG